IEKSAIEMADAIIAVSKETHQDVLNHFDVDENKIVDIYNGIDTEEYSKKKSTEFLESEGIDAEKPYVLFVGRITRQKGIIHLVNAIKNISTEYQVILCAGAPDTEEIEIEMQKAVNSIKKEREGVFWVDKMLSKEAIIEFYSHADIFCCPSIYEPFGIINLEAMACETAIVASAVGGIKEVVVDGETGILVPVEQQNKSPFEPLNPEKYSLDLANAINQLIKNPTLRKRMATNGRIRAKEMFSWHSIAEQTKKLYKSLLSGN
ncbi:MAG: glycogen synthase, partial [Verrucomicrobiota bacterium]|nr:glycogen synthase [Verrucomicrobiota bacterium]